jgi:orotidine-5'-phosphate decarboxylase
MTAVEKLLNKNLEGKFICVGLDTDISKIPIYLSSASNPILEFNQAIINSTKNAAAAYKINFAFYEKDGEKGLKNLSETIEIIPSNTLIIADAKRGDIGNTSSMYAKSVFDYFKCDAVTLNPFMGKDSLEPFLDYKEKLNFILTLTSNKGATDFEKLKLDDGRFLYQAIIEKIVEWNSNNNCGLVFGATNSSELKENVQSFGSLPVLLPGVGAQGGKLEDVIVAFESANKSNFLINISRGILYKSSDKDFAEKASEELVNLNKRVDSVLNETY